MASHEGADYWTSATKAEALLLLERFEEASAAYAAAFAEAEFDRYLATTAAQAVNIIEKLGDPPEAAATRSLLDQKFPSLPAAIADQETAAEEKEIAR